METKKIIDILNCPYLYTNGERKQAVKEAISLLDKIAEKNIGACKFCGRKDIHAASCPYGPTYVKQLP